MKTLRLSGYAFSALVLILMLALCGGRAQAKESAKVKSAVKLAHESGTRLDPANFPLSEQFVGRGGKAGPLLTTLFPPPPAPAGGFAYSFIQVSDIQLRDPNTPLNPIMHLSDNAVESSENNYFQDRTDLFYAAYLLRVIRAAADPGPASFVIHTGDAMHFSTVSELSAFTQLTQDFLLKNSAGAGGYQGSWLAAAIGPSSPARWYFNLIGNHDIQYIGNARNELSPHMYAKTGESPRLNYNRLAGQLADVGRGGDALALKAGAYSGPERLDGLTEGAGWYAFTMPIPGHPANKKVMIIVLNTNETGRAMVPKGGVFGTISPAQRQWLEERLAAADQDNAIDHVLIFGHQPLRYITETLPNGKIQTPAGFLVEPLERHPKVIAYLCGHDHQGRIVLHTRAGAMRLLEYVSPGVMDYPKAFTYLTVRSDGPGRYQVTPRLYNLEDLARAGAIDATPLLDQDLIALTRNGLGYEVRWLNDSASLKRNLRPLAKHLATLNLTPAQQSLYLALICQEAAQQDGVKIKARFDLGVYKPLDGHTFAEWREAVPSGKSVFEREIVIDKTGGQ
jgi:3',5'-cyclic AMP phosphodiesterase CpdA